MREHEFYQSHLNRVSRSFAFCIEILVEPFRRWTALSYLICRILDTVEDAHWENPTTQAAHFERFESFLQALPGEDRVQDWVDSFPSTITDGERVLLRDTEAVLADLHALPFEARSAIATAVTKMCFGMKDYALRASEEKGVLKLRDIADVNRYCYYVAGVVGELLTEFLRIHRAAKALVDSHPPDQDAAVRFGLFLQKVNILKDQRTDETENRHFVPDRQKVFASVEGDAQGAFAYLCSIPVDEKEYRLFCGWSLFMGLATLSILENRTAGATGEDGPGKLSRAETLELLAKVESAIDSQVELEALFSETA